MSNGWAKAIEGALTVLAGAAFATLLIVMLTVNAIRSVQEEILAEINMKVNSLEVGETRRHDQLMTVCLTMEERMCEHICDKLEANED